jgi:hypothetical protein
MQSQATLCFRCASTLTAVNAAEGEGTSTIGISSPAQRVGLPHSRSNILGSRSADSSRKKSSFWFVPSFDIGVVCGILLGSGLVFAQAAYEGSEAWRGSVPARECSYYVRDAKGKVKADSESRSKPPFSVVLPCYPGSAEEEDDTHHQYRNGSKVSQSQALPSCDFVIESVLADRSVVGPSVMSTVSPENDAVPALAHLGMQLRHVQQLERHGIVVLDGLLRAEELTQISTELNSDRYKMRLHMNPNEASEKDKNLDMFFAGEGFSAKDSSGEKYGDIIRSDRTFFLCKDDRQNSQGERVSSESAIHKAELLLRSLGDFLESKCFAGFQRSYASGSSGTLHSDEVAVQQRLCVPDDTQLAVYGAKGAFYRPHRDGYKASLEDGLLGWLRSRSYSLRIVTGILYLNDNGPESVKPWREEHGGCLRVYFPARNGSAMLSSPNSSSVPTGSGSVENPYYVDIPPVGGRLVIFDSQEILHEVRPTFKERAAITVWFLAA